MSHPTDISPDELAAAAARAGAKRLGDPFALLAFIGDMLLVLLGRHPGDLVVRAAVATYQAWAALVVAPPGTDPSPSQTFHDGLAEGYRSAMDSLAATFSNDGVGGICERIRAWTEPEIEIEEEAAEAAQEAYADAEGASSREALRLAVEAHRRVISRSDLVVPTWPSVPVVLGRDVAGQLDAAGWATPGHPWCCPVCSFSATSASAGLAHIAEHEKRADAEHSRVIGRATPPADAVPAFTPIADAWKD